MSHIPIPTSSRFTPSQRRVNTVSACLYFTLFMKNWWPVKPVEMIDFPVFCTVHSDRCNQKGMFKDLCVLSVFVLTFMPHCLNRRNQPRRPSFLLWSLWWNGWRGKARGLFCEIGQSTRLLEAACCSVKRPGCFLHQTTGRKDKIFYPRQLDFIQAAASKQRQLSELNYSLVWRAVAC